MKNNPLMYVDSVGDVKSGEENQDMYDSRANKKNKALHRIDDIKAMLFNKINILVEIKTKNTLYEGVVKGLNDRALELLTNKEIINISINDIVSINILKL